MEILVTILFYILIGYILVIEFIGITVLIVGTICELIDLIKGGYF